MSLVEMLIQEALAAPEERKKEALRVLRGEADGIRKTEIGNQAVPEEYLTLKACAKRLGFAACSLWRWQVPGHSLGGRPRFRVSEVEKYLNSPEFQKRATALRKERLNKLAFRTQNPSAPRGRPGRKKKVV